MIREAFFFIGRICAIFSWFKNLEMDALDSYNNDMKHTHN